ncbi:MAG: hypothetical protein EA376_02000 [Phycisphaeraceae bacterium]|nr:MAG: hypothetical protein EA376_02000 [Phycisphaeraceae bacterium]
MFADVAIHWFIAQALAALAAYLFGRMIGRGSTSMVEIGLLLLAALAIGWAMRHAYQDALLHILPLEMLVYTEGTLIVPAVMLLAGILSVNQHIRRRHVLGPLLGAFGVLYLCFNGMWMLSPHVDLAEDSGMEAGPGVFAQTREDTCVAASLATALGAPGIGVRTSESEMARLADVRVGQGSTLMRALRAAQLRLDGLGIEARLLNITAEQAVSFASTDVPMLVTLRSGARRRHMVVLQGWTPDDRVLIANPWIDSQLGDPDVRAPAGLAAISFGEFSRLYTGAAIVFLRAELPRNAPLITRAATVYWTEPEPEDAKSAPEHMEDTTPAESSEYDDGDWLKERPGGES